MALWEGKSGFSILFLRSLHCLSDSINGKNDSNEASLSKS
jgi:hypothetical protein